MIKRTTLGTETTIIVSTIQAFRVDDTEGRKVYEPDGSLMEHFSNVPKEILPKMDRYEDGKPKETLANEDSKEKRVLGELWEERSKGKCLFVMPKGKNFEAIVEKIGNT